ncbi:type I-C CRISPR-associated protein Cas8c/Csd1 [Lederbergia sp. NSJ-179]|uniref:type I-C CRISPR-associated protein Cas8c/Csd1 n=1 Tax=Lederbergia sp. NSJ-179 TaxID=2931402 RepID=UPI001FD0D4FC|nr:type I-C CRISPR-associated protein Cas8c/Csd1 [Lederbergia sp. NSJ-179]MCJ7840491.1 type I-C CRISPR-associated protein Cas8c/Csd1 [Lederbergia sp. NSJ-179]
MQEAKRAIEYLLFESGISNYKISQMTGISPPVLGKYSNGKSDIENMTFGNAIKLYNCYLQLKEEKEIGNKDRDLLFGRLFGVCDVFGQLVFEKGKSAVQARYMEKFQRKPMTTFAKIHEELMNYTHKFGDKEERLIRLFDQIVDKIGIESYDDRPLSDKWLLGFYKQRHEIASDV